MGKAGGYGEVEGEERELGERRWRRGEGARSKGRKGWLESEILKDCIAWRWEWFVKICIA